MKNLKHPNYKNKSIETKYLKNTKKNKQISKGNE